MGDMGSMFDHASSFNQDLCPWAKKLPPSFNAWRMFGGSGCAFRQSPNEELTPFCASDCGIEGQSHSKESKSHSKESKSHGKQVNWSRLGAVIGVIVAAGLTG